MTVKELPGNTTAELGIGSLSTGELGIGAVSVGPPVEDASPPAVEVPPAEVPH